MAERAQRVRGRDQVILRGTRRDTLVQSTLSWQVTAIPGHPAVPYRANAVTCREPEDVQTSPGYAQAKAGGLLLTAATQLIQQRPNTPQLPVLFDCCTVRNQISHWLATGIPLQAHSTAPIPALRPQGREASCNCSVKQDIREPHSVTRQTLQPTAHSQDRSRSSRVVCPTPLPPLFPQAALLPLLP